MNAIIRGPLELSIEAALIQNEISAEKIESVKTTTGPLSAAQAEYREAARHIATDERFSDAGRKTNLAQLRENQANRYLKIVGERLTNLDKRIGELAYQVRPQNPDTDATRELMLMQEVRGMIADWEELQLTEEYLGLAVSGDNDLWMRAVEQSPVPLIMDQSILENGKHARGLRESPEAGETLRELKVVRSAIQAALDNAMFELNIPDRTLEAAAAGTVDD